MGNQMKIKFSGIILSVQPRSNVWRYKMDNRNHSTTGYNIFIKGVAEDTEKEFSVAISEKQQAKLLFHIGDSISGSAWTKKYPEWEYADYYRAGSLKKIKSISVSEDNSSEPWTGETPPLDIYNKRGCRMLDTRTYKTKCFTCKWACMANVTIEYDWGASLKIRFESFCYGPKSCKNYKMGRARSVPYKGTTPFYDTGWLDEICMENREDD